MQYFFGVVGATCSEALILALRCFVLIFLHPVCTGMFSLFVIRLFFFFFSWHIERPSFAELVLQGLCNIHPAICLQYAWNHFSLSRCVLSCFSLYISFRVSSLVGGWMESRRQVNWFARTLWVEATHTKGTIGSHICCVSFGLAEKCVSHFHSFASSGFRFIKQTAQLTKWQQKKQMRKMMKWKKIMNLMNMERVRIEACRSWEK